MALLITTNHKLYEESYNYISCTLLSYLPLTDLAEKCNQFWDPVLASWHQHVANKVIASLQVDDEPLVNAWTQSYTSYILDWDWDFLALVALCGVQLEYVVF